MRKCKNCGWIHFSVTRKYAEAEVNNFNNYFNQLSKEDQSMYYGGEASSIASYENCFRCGNSYKNFVKALDKEIPKGSTLQPILRSR